jgi:hypothetical protein
MVGGLIIATIQALVLVPTYKSSIPGNSVFISPFLGTDPRIVDSGIQAVVTRDHVTVPGTRDIGNRRVCAGKLTYGARNTATFN